jgi:hypothetical protein
MAKARMALAICWVLGVVAIQGDSVIGLVMGENPVFYRGWKLACFMQGTDARARTFVDRAISAVRNPGKQKAPQGLCPFFVR